MAQSQNESAYIDWPTIIENQAVNNPHKLFIESIDQDKRITFGEMRK